MKRLWEAGILLFAAAGFWGMIYPDLCFVQDVCRVEYVQEDEQEQSGAEKREIRKNQCSGSMDRDSGGTCVSSGRDGSMWEPDIYTRICEAEPEHVQVKSRLLEWIRN